MRVTKEKVIRSPVRDAIPAKMIHLNRLFAEILFNFYLSISTLNLSEKNNT